MPLYAFYLTIQNSRGEAHQRLVVSHSAPNVGALVAQLNREPFIAVEEQRVLPGGGLEPHDLIGVSRDAIAKIRPWHAAEARP